MISIGSAVVGAKISGWTIPVIPVVAYLAEKEVNGRTR